MDNRHRVYYLTNLHQNWHLGGWWKKGYDSYGFLYEANLQKLRQSIPSLKIRPYGFTDYRGVFWQLKLSCKREEAVLLFDTLDSLEGVDWSVLDENGEPWMTHICRNNY